MLRVLVVATLLLTCLDHWTTYLCLHAPVDGWSVVEANPVAQWLFEHAGLGMGLAIDSLLTAGAILFLATTHVFGHGLKLAILAFITCSTGYAVANNFEAITRMGLDPLAGLV
jgi:hypothetical protein